MAVFVDTSIFVAVRNKRDRNHQKARELMKHALTAEFGVIHTSDYVVDEAVTTALARTRNHQIAVNTGRYILDSERIEKHAISREDFNLAWSKFKTVKDRFLSFTDCTSLALMERRGIERIMSFDSNFDGLAERIY
ncbi:type II toxin-antitoxin system VapC family toxin [Candidatus Bathyarchaeota archaeon]|nr:type II toxin-antitoxin system VapC family toxin [Candidatus Bathyarchaeota archaeon]